MSRIALHEKLFVSSVVVLLLSAILIGPAAAREVGDPEQIKKSLSELYIPEVIVEEIAVKVAYSEEELFFEFSWEAPGPGIYDGGFIYDGRRWTEVESGPMGPTDGISEDQLTLMLDNRHVPEFTLLGGIITFREGMEHLPGELDTEEIKAHPHLGRKLGNEALNPYLPRTRRGKGWDELVSEEKLDELIDKGYFLEIWNWRAHKTAPLGYADQGYILESRYMRSSEEELFVKNWDEDQKRPRWIFDPSEVDFYTLKRENLKAKEPRNGKFHYLSRDLAREWTDNYKPKEGDFVPGYLLEYPREDSRLVRATSSWEDGRWTLRLRRAMDTGNRIDKAFSPGDSLTFSVAIHKNDSNSRWQYLSLPVSVSLGGEGEADLQAAWVEGDAFDWQQIPELELTLFFPGQTTWEFLTSSEEHPGAYEILKNGEGTVPHPPEEIAGYILGRRERLIRDALEEALKGEKE